MGRTRREDGSGERRPPARTFRFRDDWPAAESRRSRERGPDPCGCRRPRVAGRPRSPRRCGPLSARRPALAQRTAGLPPPQTPQRSGTLSGPAAQRLPARLRPPQRSGTLSALTGQMLKAKDPSSRRPSGSSRRG